MEEIERVEELTAGNEGWNFISRTWNIWSANEKIKGHTAILLTTLVMTLNIPISKYLLPILDAYTISMVRIGGACLIAWLVGLFCQKEHVSWRDKGFLLLGSVFGLSFNQTIFMVGLHETGPIEAAIVIASGPVVVMILSALFLKEPISVMKSAGVAVGLSGALLVIFSNGISGALSGNIMGNFLVFLSVISYAIYLLVIRTVANKYAPITLLKWMLLGAMILFSPLGGPRLLASPICHDGVSLPVIGCLIAITLGGTFIGFLLVPVALKRLRPTTVSMYNYLQPILVSLIAVVFAMDTLTWQKPVAVVLIFIGVGLVSRSRARADTPQNQRRKA